MSGYEIRLLPSVFDQGQIRLWCEENLEPETWAISFGIQGRLIVDEVGAMAFKLAWMPENIPENNQG